MPYVDIARVEGVWAGWQGWYLAKVPMVPRGQHVAANRARARTGGLRARGIVSRRGLVWVSAVHDLAYTPE